MDGIVKVQKKEVEDSDVTMELPPPCRDRIQLVMMAMLVMLVLLLTVCMWFFAYRAPRLAITRLTESLRKDVAESTIEFLDELFRWNAYGAKSLVVMLEKELLGDGISLESFRKIRVASWSLFKAIPVITSIGVTASNGLTALYVRGGLYPEEDSEKWQNDPIFVSTRSTEELSPYYIESVNSSTGEGLGDSKEYYFKEHFKNREWFRSTLSIPVGETAWHVEKSAMSIQSGIPVLCSMSNQMVVVHCSHSVKVVADYLSTSLDLKGGSLFVANDVGEILFSSEEQCLSRKVNECKGYSEAIGEAVKYIKMQIHLKNLVNEEIHYAKVKIGGRHYSIDSFYQSFQGMKMAVVTIIPCQSVWQTMDTQAQFASVTIPILVLGLSFFGCIVRCILMEWVALERRLRSDLLHQSEAKKRAEAGRDAKTAFLSHMSHELRTPMACIIGLLEILMGDLKLSEHESSVKQVHRCATSLVTLLNSALDIAKVEAGKLELEKADFNLETELCSLIDVFSVQCDAKGLHLSLELSDNIPNLVNGDPARVMQIFTNLLGNGIKFTQAGRIIVRGWVDELGAGEGTTLQNPMNTHKDQVVMMFEVDDTGPGIDKALRERVFENFVQGDVSIPRTHGGTGLGLGIARSLVHLMGGAIRIGDKAGSGTLFQFSLCFDLPSDHTEYRTEIVKHRQIVLGMPEQDCRDIVAHWLEDRGLPVHQAGSWEEVLIHLKALPATLCGRQIEENSEKIILEEDSSQSKRIWKGHRRVRHSGARAIRRSKSDGTADNRAEKPVLIVDVGLLPPFINETAYLQNFERLGFALKNGIPVSSSKSLDFHALVWVTASNTPAAFKRALKLLNRSVLVRRPLHASRLRDLFHQLEAREQFVPLDGKGINPAPSPLSVKISKQLSTLYTGDEAACCSEGVDGTSSDDCRQDMDTVYEGSNDGAKANLVIPSSESFPGVSHQAHSMPLVRSKSDNVSKLIKVARPKPAGKALERLEILVAEDHPLLRRLAVTMLRKLGAIPYEACDGQEALKSVITRFESHLLPFHCILMDCQMPIMDGYDACKSIREFEDKKEQHTRIIALTANAMAADKQRCFSVGMDAFLSKPIQQDHLTRVILSMMTTTNQEPGVPDEKQL